MTPYENIAAELLPCMCGYEVTDGPVPAVAWDGDHFEGCPALYRAAVALRMREIVEIEYERMIKSSAWEIESRDKRIEELEQAVHIYRAELAALKADNAQWKYVYKIRGKALRLPCLNCGYQPAEIKAKDSE